MELFKKNLELLRSSQPSLARRVEREPKKNFVHVSISKDGNPIPKIGSVSLHSKYYPSKEAKDGLCAVGALVAGSDHVHHDDRPHRRVDAKLARSAFRFEKAISKAIQALRNTKYWRVFGTLHGKEKILNHENTKDTKSQRKVMVFLRAFHISTRNPRDPD